MSDRFLTEQQCAELISAVALEVWPHVGKTTSDDRVLRVLDSIMSVPRKRAYQVDEWTGKHRRTVHRWLVSVNLPSVKEWMMLARLLRAAKVMARYPQLPYSIVSRVSGYSDESTFSRQVFETLNARPCALRDGSWTTDRIWTLWWAGWHGRKEAA